MIHSVFFTIYSYTYAVLEAELSIYYIPHLIIVYQLSVTRQPFRTDDDSLSLIEVL